MSNNTKKYKLVCSIVLYENDQRTLERTIKSIYYSRLDKVQICLTDNSPKKLIYIDELLLKYPEVEYFHNDKNLGYGYANNQVMEKYINDTEYFLVLNPDIEFNEDALSPIYNFMNKNQEVGLCGAKIINKDKGLQYANKKLPTLLDVLIRFLGNKMPILGRMLKKIFKKSRDKYKLKNLDHHKNILCPVISGCFMFFRASVLKEAGGFDTRFFMYYDDVDLSRRVFSIHKVILFNEVPVIHVWQRSSYKHIRLLKEHIKSTIKYFNKWGWFFDKERNKINNKVRNI